MLKYGCVLYSGAALSHINCLNSFQSHIENMCDFSFPSLTDRRNASILGFTCHLLDGEGWVNLQTFCPTFKKSPIRSSNRLHSFDLASHLCFINICNFRTLDRFHCSWQATIVPLWDSVLADLLLQGNCVGWRTVLKDIQRTISILSLYAWINNEVLKH